MSKRMIAWMLVLALLQVPSVWADPMGENPDPVESAVTDGVQDSAAVQVAHTQLVEQAKAACSNSDGSPQIPIDGPYQPHPLIPMNPHGVQIPIEGPYRPHPLIPISIPMVLRKSPLPPSVDEVPVTKDGSVPAPISIPMVLRGPIAPAAGQALPLAAAAMQPPANPQASIGPSQRTLPFYRLYDPSADRHLYTASANEREALIGAGWRAEGTSGHLLQNPAPGLAALYRLYNPNSAGHFLTASEVERNILVQLGWTPEGIVGYLHSEGVSGTTPLYRLYRDDLLGKGRHLYSTSPGERDVLLATGRWRDEGVVGHVVLPPAVSLARTVPGSLYGINGLWTDPLSPESDRNEVANSTGQVAVNLVWAEWDMGGELPPPGFDEKDYIKYETEYGTEYFKVNHQVDEEIRFYSERGIPVLGKLFGTPPRFQVPGSLPAGQSLYHAPTARGMGYFSRFAGMLAQRYNGAFGHGAVTKYEIGNEANRGDWWSIDLNNGGHYSDTIPIDTERWMNSYAEFFKTAYDAIQLRQPTAKIFVSLDHAFSASLWDRPYQDHRGRPSLSTQTFLKKFAARMEGRTWRVAYHPYNTDLSSPVFDPNDAALSGTVTMGNLGVLVGWLRKTFPNNPEVYGDIMLTESGFHSDSPSSSEQAQADALSRSFRNVLGTPGITGYIYQRMRDHPGENGLHLGLHDALGTAKPAWSTWIRMNHSDSLDSGFELLPFTKLTRGYHPQQGHWASSRLLPSGFVEEMSWKLLRAPHPTRTTRMLYEVGDGTHVFLSLDPASEDQELRGPLGYVYTDPEPGLVPLYQSAISATGDRFITSNPHEGGWGVEQLLGYVYPSDATPKVFSENELSALLAIPNPVAKLNPLPALAGPSRLTADAFSSSRIHLSWVDNASNETGFKVYRSQDGVNFSLIGTTGAGVYFFSDTGLHETTQYYYKVRAFNDASESVDFNTVSAWTTRTLPAGPSRLMADAFSSSRIHLSWEYDFHPDNDWVAFEIYQSLDGVNFSFSAATYATSFSKTGLSANTLYYYAVRAVRFPGRHSSEFTFISARTL